MAVMKPAAATKVIFVRRNAGKRTRFTGQLRTPHLPYHTAIEVNPPGLFSIPHLSTR